MVRARREVTTTERDAVLRLWPSMGRERIVERLGISDRQVRRVVESAGLVRGRHWRAWTEREDSHLRDHAGEQGVTRLARELRRSPAAVRNRLAHLALVVGELRKDLTAVQIADLVGRDVPRVLASMRRGELRAHKSDGAWRAWASDVRAWIDHDTSVLCGARVGVMVVDGEPVTGGMASLWALARRKI